MESSLQSPRIASVPQPEAFQPAPPPPRALTMPAAPAGQNAAPAAARLPGPPAPAPLPPELGSAKFQPAPPPPNLPAPAPTRTAAATGGGKAEKPAPPAAFTQVADITFAADSTTLSDADRHTLGKVVPRYQGKPGTVRVVGYAGIASSAAQQLSSYRTALDRAHAVAAALARAGIPSDKIEVEAAPAGSDSGQGRAEVLLQR
jgi:outer membrane protein OmpA-like peptidoglycan-associated protein